ncbi:MAG: (4Fe-4S)-binding protein, partial [Deltaproteobacteria bacterium]|nr:(4Fe-4S)-binding protein [Deltaproteobacteria bacterium]
TDGPPGVGCPVIASIGGATAVLIVAEPTVSGRHDMERVVELAEFFKVPSLVCINKFDLNPEAGAAIEDFSRDRNVTVMGRIPFDPAFTRAMVQGKNIVEFDSSSKGARAVSSIWRQLSQYLQL